MKHAFLFFLICIPVILAGQNTFDEYFLNKSLRIDYVIAGSRNETHIYLKKLKEEPFWGGPKKNIIDTFNYGGFKLLVFDLNSKNLIFSRGFSTLFSEWQATKESKTIDRSFPYTSIIPFPKNEILVEIHQRINYSNFEKKFTLTINPNSFQICRDKPIKFKSTKMLDSGPSSAKIDIVFIAEGYTKNEMHKFKYDVQRISDAILKATPFNNYQDKFNIWAVESASRESGTDIPAKKIFKNTITNFSFSTFNLDRYLVSFDSYAIHDIAANVPYDQLFIIINTPNYGGSGFYNFYASTSADHPVSDIVAIHEFGHSFAGLADEYTDSESVFENFYPINIEPWEPNITTLIQFENKWKNLISPDVPVPTPREDKYNNKIGVFEGGGYSGKGIYSPFMECRMKSFKSKQFCPVCQRAIIKKIQFYIDH